MSEEEIINNIKTMLEKNDEIFDEIGTDLYFSKSTAEVIQGLLDLYNKEKEKNIQLLNSKIGVDLSFADYISKDKIRKRLKELEEDMVLAEVRIELQELLEE